MIRSFLLKKWNFKIFTLGTLLLFAITVLPSYATAQVSTKIPVEDQSAKELKDKEVGKTIRIFGKSIPVPLTSLDSLAYFAAKKVAEKMSDSVVDWIKTGRDGGPAFVTNPQQYFEELASGVAGEFIQGSELGFLCSPFQAQIRLSLATEYGGNGESQFQCTLSEIAGNIDAFYDDFSQGGWDAWFSMTQNPINNPYGAYLQAKIELDSRVASKIQEKTDELNRGRGFLSYQKCRGQMLPPEERRPDTNNGCLGEWETVTPGSIVETQLSNVLGSGIRQLELADEFNEIASALLGRLLSEVLGNNGLLGSSRIRGTIPISNMLIDIDGDGIADQADLDGDGVIDICYFGGVSDPVEPPCRVSSDQSTPPYIPPEQGGGGQCTFNPSSYGNDPGAPSTIDPSQVIFEEGDGVGSWPETARLESFRVDSINIYMPFDKAGTWPSTYLDTAETIGNPWIVIWRDGAWRARTFSWIRPGQTVKEAAEDIFFGGGGGAQTFGNFKPVAGEIYGFMVSGVARDMRINNIRERSNIVMYTWPSDISPKCSAGGTNPGGGSNPEIPGTPGQSGPNIFSINPTSAVAGQTSMTIVGTNLTTTVQFFNSNNQPYTAVGTVNAEKTQVTVTVPSDLPAGSASVRIRKDASTVSNTKAFQVTSSGGPIAPTPNLTAHNATSGYFGSLAYNSQANNWLVVSSSENPQNINGRIMSAGGEAVGGEFKINTDTGVQVLSPKVAYDPELNRYLVVWIGFPTSRGGTIYGRFVDALGTPTGDTLTIFTDPAGGASFFYNNGLLQYDRDNNKFALVWEYRKPSVDINLITIDSRSGAPGEVVDVGNDSTGGSWHPSIAVKSGSEYCIAYDKRNDGKIALRRYNATTGTLSAETITSISGTDMSIASGSGTNYLVGWSSTSQTLSQGKITNGCSITSGSTFTLNSAGRSPSVAYNSRSNTYASIVQNQNDSGNTYNVLSSSGTRLSSGIAFSGGNGNFSPIIFGNSSDGSFAAISALNYNPTRFATGINSQ